MYKVKEKFRANDRVYQRGETLQDADAVKILGFTSLVEKGKLALVETPVEGETTKGKDSK